MKRMHSFPSSAERMAPPARDGGTALSRYASVLVSVAVMSFQGKEKRLSSEGRCIIL
jgi:hypothetical protein